MNKINFLISVLFLASSPLLAQQESIINFYTANLNLINPAVVSTDGNTYIKSVIRNQWAGIEEAPETQTVVFTTPLRQNLALGVGIIRDKVFIEQQTFISVDISYKVKLNEQLNLFMGIKAGANNYQVNTTGLETYNQQTDPSLEQISGFNPNVGVGFYLEHSNYYISLSTPKLLDTERAKNEDGFATVASDRAHFYGSTGYTFAINTSVDLLPSMIIRYVNGAPLSTDFSIATEFNKKFKLGTGYRTDKSLIGIVQVTPSKRLQIGFAFEYIMQNNLLAKANGTTEFYLQFQL
jgi:type IX secretion system PorP/SprF family membrane protein